jgi:hypothetical protein
MLLRTAKSCGPDTPTLVSSSRSCVGPTELRQNISADDGGKTARSPGSTKETVKTIACRNAGRFRCTRCYSCAFYHYKVHTRPRVQRAPGIPHALCFPGREIHQRLGRNAPRGREDMSGWEERGNLDAVIPGWSQRVGALRGPMGTRPGISRFRVRCHRAALRADPLASPRNDGVWRARIRTTHWLAMTALQLKRLGCLKIESNNKPTRHART